MRFLRQPQLTGHPGPSLGRLSRASRWLPNGPNLLTPIPHGCKLWPVKVMLVLAAALAFAAPAAARPDPQVVALKKQVALLQAEVRQLEQTVTMLQATVKAGDECGYARAYKLSSSVFNYVDRLAAFVGAISTPTTVPAYDDHGSCAMVGITP